MNKSKIPVYQLGRTFAIPRKNAPVFSPVFDGRLLHSLYEHRGKDNIVRVGSAGADFPFLFAGALDEVEFVRAFLYIVYKDNSSHGIYYKAAEAGKFVYTHSMAAKVARWWALPDKVKYKGYRQNVL